MMYVESDWDTDVKILVDRNRMVQFLGIAWFGILP
jgi:hypothetical protein